MSVPDLLFHSPSKGTLSFQEMLKAIVSYMDEEPKHFYKVIVGTDSFARSDTTLVTAVIVQRVGRGAIYFLTKSPMQWFPTLRDRIFEEAIHSIMLAQELRSRLKEELKDEFLWESNEIHVDIGQNGPTKELIDAVSGIIRGYNFYPVIKPLSFAASTVADKHT